MATVAEIMAQAGGGKNADGQTFTEYLASVGWKPRKTPSFEDWARGQADFDKDGKIEHNGSGEWSAYNRLTNPNKKRAEAQDDWQKECAAILKADAETLAGYLAIWKSNLPPTELINTQQEAYLTKSNQKNKFVMILIGGAALIIAIIIFSKKKR